jgi:hypothetical protein
MAETKRCTRDGCPGTMTLRERYLDADAGNGPDPKRPEAPARFGKAWECSDCGDIEPSRIRGPLFGNGIFAVADPRITDAVREDVESMRDYVFDKPIPYSAPSPHFSQTQAALGSGFLTTPSRRSRGATILIFIVPPQSGLGHGLISGIGSSSAGFVRCPRQGAA